MTPQISIITPSYNQLGWLRLATASVADQNGIEIEHIVQDAGTGPELENWARQHPRVKLFIEKDAGMYDAINRGLKKASGQICGYLNCDEQYLPNVLSRVADEFESHPEADVVFAHAIVVNQSGGFVAFRKATVPGKYHTWVSQNIAILTCATFFRRRILDRHQLFFDSKLKDVGDADWIIRMLNKGLRMRMLPIFTSVFTETDQNRNLAPTALREKEEIVASAPRWARAFRQPIIACHRLRRFLAGAYRQEPFDYAIYTRENPKVRTVFHVDAPTYRWRR